MSNYTIYHNPRCSKSRQTLALLKENNIAPDVVEYLQNPPDTQTLAQILNMLGLQPRELMRRNEAAYAENNLADETLSDNTLIQAMIDHPILIERPIVISDGRAVLGRPPENVLELI